MVQREPARAGGSVVVKLSFHQIGQRRRCQSHDGLCITSSPSEGSTKNERSQDLRRPSRHGWVVSCPLVPVWSAKPEPSAARSRLSVRSTRDLGGRSGATDPRRGRSWGGFGPKRLAQYVGWVPVNIGNLHVVDVVASLEVMTSSLISE